MAAETYVNSQITDAVTQSNVTVLAQAPAKAMAVLYQMMAQAIGVSMQNAVANQQSMNTLDAAIVTQGVNLLYSMDTASDAAIVEQTLGDHASAEAIRTLLAAMQAVQPAKGSRRP
ncbi:RebB family R body protein [Oceanibacterium hippocampi]|uniref:Killing trait n=1 Tax=Oceanibacterium hippocampi TaxID=745714 RepID=A0A1Y5T7N6_9PROT|nr:RebB family R body protein [Oceanibacterium hippocampi]SLN57761.1 Killing trait [Oceanibacterium hippocampi]